MLILYININYEKKTEQNSEKLLNNSNQSEERCTNRCGVLNSWSSVTIMSWITDLKDLQVCDLIQKWIIRN